MIRGWLALEFGESQIVSEDRGCRPGKLGNAQDRQLKWSAFGGSSIVDRIVVGPLDQRSGKVDACVGEDLL